MDSHEDLIGGRKDLGTRPVEPGVVRAERSRRTLTRFKVATATAVGFLVGSVGLAAAGTLPAPAQGVAHSVLKTAGVNVPPGHDRFNDPAVCPGGPYRNHGAFVRAHKDDPNAGASPCGKPTRAVQGGHERDDASETGEAPGNGPPPWAHGKDKGPKQDKGQGEKSKEPGAAPSTTTTSPTAPTTTSPSPTTTAPTTTTAPSTTTTSQP